MKRFKMFILASTAVLMLLSVGFLAACGEELVDPATILSSIAITKQPSKREYVVGQSLDLTALVVTATMEDGTTKTTIPEADYTVEPSNGTVLTTPGSVTVTVTYQEKTATTTVTVVAKAVTSLEVAKYPTKRSYAESEVVDLTGLELSAKWNDNTSTAVNIADCSATLTGDVITVTAHGKTVAYTIKSDLVAKDFTATNSYNSHANGIVDNLDQNALLDFWNPDQWTNYQSGSSWSYDSSGQKPVLDGDILKFTSETKMQRFDAFRIDNSIAKAAGAPNAYDNIGAEVYKTLDDQVFTYTTDVKATGAYKFMLFSAQGTLPTTTSGTSMAIFFSRTATGYEISSVNMGGTAVGSISDEALVLNDDDFNRLDFTMVRKDSNITLTFYINGIRIFWNNQGATSDRAKIVDGNFVFQCGQKENGPSSTARSQNDFPNYGHRFCVVPDTDTEVLLRKTVVA